jgi:polyisoprenoid-binding protein YceI
MSARMKMIGVAAGAMITLAATAANLLTLQPDSKIWVSGGSTVRDYKCNATTIDATITAPDDIAVPTLPQLVKTAQIEIPVAQLDCGNGTMNDHMRKALKAKDNPRIVFTLDSYRIVESELQLTGRLTIAGVERPIELTGQVKEENGVARATASKQIRMTEWGVKPPSLMLGTMKVKDAVTIAFDIGVAR